MFLFSKISFALIADCAIIAYFVTHADPFAWTLAAGLYAFVTVRRLFSIF